MQFIRMLMERHLLAVAVGNPDGPTPQAAHTPGDTTEENQT